jgi:autotransporter-associated beta strand protein
MKSTPLTILAGSILTLISPVVHGQFYVAQFNGLEGNNLEAGENSNRTLPIAGSGLYDIADFNDPEAGHGGNFNFNLAIPANTSGGDDNYSIAASGILNVLTTGTYRFSSHTDDASRIVIDGRNVNAQQGCCSNVDGPNIFLEAGTKHFIQVTYREGGGGSGGDFSVALLNTETQEFGEKLLLGTGENAHPSFNVTQTGGFTLAGVAGSTPGLFGAYYSTPGLANQNFATDAFLADAANQPTGTFTSTQINYNTGGGGTVAAHLGTDGTNLTAGGENSTDDSLFKFDGFIQISPSDDLDLTVPGIQVKFVLGADDNARLRIGGLTIMENDGGHGAPHFFSANTDTLAQNSGDNAGGTALVSFETGGVYALNIYYHNGGGGLAGQFLSSIGLDTGDVQAVPGTRLFQVAVQAGGAKYYNGGAGNGVFESGGAMIWRTSNTEGASNTTFQNLDQAVFGNLGTQGARIVTVAAAGVQVDSFTVENSVANPYTIGGGGAIGGPAGLLKNGPGSLTMLGDNTFQGAVTIKHGTVEAATIGDTNNAGALGQGPRITLGDAAGANDAVLRYTGGTATVSRELVTDVTGGTVEITQAASTLTFSSALNGTGPFTKAGAGSLAISGTAGAGFTGTVNVTGGNLSLARLGAGAAGTSLNISNGSSFSYSGASGTDARAVTIGTGGGTINITRADTRLRMSGAVTAGSGFTVGGPGRLALSGQATLTAMPVIQNGSTLALQNEATGAGANVLPTAGITLTTGTLEVAPNALGNNTAAITLAGGTLRLGSEGLLGQYYNSQPAGAAGNNDENTRIPLSGSLSTVNSFFSGLTPALQARTNTNGLTNLTFRGGDGAPFASQGFESTNEIYAKFTGKILITSAGPTTFFTNSDDGSAIFINGQQVVSNNFFQGDTERSGVIDLPVGLHTFDMYFYEGGGGANLTASYTPAGGTKQLIPNNVLFSGETYDAATRNIVVTANSALEIAAGRANLGTLTQTGGTTLSLTGSANFAGTTLTGAGALNLNNRIGNVNLGPITATTPVINKSGDGRIIFSQAPPTGTTINVNGGVAVSQGSEAGGVTTDPLAGATLVINDGGGIGFGVTSGNPTYTRAITAAGNYRIEAGRFESPHTEPAIVTLAPSNGLTIAAGATLTMRSERHLNFSTLRPVAPPPPEPTPENPNPEIPPTPPVTPAVNTFTLNVNAPVTGGGTLVIEDGKINFASNVSPAGGLTVQIADVTVTGPVNTGALNLTNQFNGTTPLSNANVPLLGTLTVAGTVNATSVTVSGGVFNPQQAVTATGPVVVSGGTVNAASTFTANGAFTVSGGTFNAAQNLTAGAVTVSGGTLNTTQALNAASVTVTGGTVNAADALTSAGPLAVSGGSTTVTGLATAQNINVTGGTLTLAGGVSTTGPSSISGGGTLIYQGNVNQTQNLNIAGGTFEVQNGITDLGQSTISVAAKRFTPGLLEGRIANGDLNGAGGTEPNPGIGRPDSDTGGIRLSPRMGLTGRTGGGDYWGNEETWVYTGEFFDADGRFAFAESIDDRVRVRIDGVQVLANDQWQTATSTGRTDGLVTNNGDGNLRVGDLRPDANGSADPDSNFGMGPGGDGWHTIEIRFANGGGGAGALGDTGATGWGGGDDATYMKKGFGLMADLIRETSADPNVPGPISLNGNDYALPIEPGLESGPTLFRVAAAGTGGRIAIASGSTLRAGSITGGDIVTFAGRAALS